MTDTMLTRMARAMILEMERQAKSREPEFAGNCMVEADHFGGRPLVLAIDHHIHIDLVAKAALEAVREEIEAMPALVADPGKYLGVVLRESEYGDLLKMSDVLAILQGEA